VIRKMLMIKQFLYIGLIAVLPGYFSCNSKTNNNTLQTQSKPQQMAITAETLKQVLEAFNRHDLDAIMEYFSDDCSFDFPRGPEAFGQRFVGKEQVREALAGRFRGIPDVHYGDDRHWVAGNMGVSEWTLTGTTTTGVKLNVRGCDLWEFRNDKIIRKNSYWKIVE
jgi:ketosteroid isomerase-like protein